MGKGYVRMTNALIKEAFGFPPDWEIEKIEPVHRNGIIVEGESSMLISGSDFPEVNNRGDAEDVLLVVHEKAKSFEVKKV